MKLRIRKLSAPLAAWEYPVLMVGEENPYQTGEGPGMTFYAAPAVLEYFDSEIDAWEPVEVIR
jgi:hypothetical protein